MITLKHDTLSFTFPETARQVRSLVERQIQKIVSERPLTSLMKTKKAAISFDAGALVARVEGFAAGRQPARERTMKLPPPVKPIRAKQIRAIHVGLGCTQTEFALLLNVPAITAISWENGTRKPSGAALRLLAVARHHPEALHAA